MAKTITIVNENAYPIEVALIGRSGDTKKVPAKVGSTNGTLELSGDGVVWYTATQVFDFYENTYEGVSGITVNQTSNTTVTVYITDTSGDAISGASVVLGSTTKTTDTNGKAEFKAFATGNTTLAVTATGYTSISATDVTISDALETFHFQMQSA